MNKDKESEETITYLKKLAKEYRTYGDLDNPEFEDTKKIANAIDTAVGTIEKLQQDNYNLDRENQKLFESQINSIPKKKLENIVKYYKRQKIRLERYIKEMHKKELSRSGEREKGYYEGNLSRIEDILDRIKELLEGR